MWKALALSGLILASGPDGPSDELFDKLASAPDDAAAAQAEADVLDALLESGSATVDLLMSRAAGAVGQGDLGLARALYDRVILIKPDYAEAWRRRAFLFLNDDAYDEALRDINEALTLEPRHFGAWAELGAILEQLGARDEALEAYREALALHPHLASAKAAEQRLLAASDGSTL